MIWLYRILFLPLLLIASPYYLKRMFKRGGYSKDFRHRFGFVKELSPKDAFKKRIWIQAVSVGEIKAIGPLLEKLKELGNVEIVLTTTTSTGYVLASELYSKACISINLFPIDFWFFSALAWRRINPDLAILMESELWPEHLHQANARKTPIILINARLSDKSFERYQKFQRIAQALLKKLTFIGASGEQDLKRIRELGASKEKSILTGNLKLDVTPPVELSPEERLQLKTALGFSKDSFVLLGSSTWPGEEEMLIQLLNLLINREVDARLLLVPRHAERRYEIKDLLKKQPLSFHFRSSHESVPKQCKIYVGDTTGELTTLSQVADIAVIGKSFPPNNGGQTPIEAAGLGLPVIFGPDMANFRYIARALEQSNAALRCEDFDLLTEKIVFLQEHEEVRKNMGESGRKWHESNRGATAKTLQIIQKYTA